MACADSIPIDFSRSKKAEDRLNAAQDVLLRLFSGRARVKTLKDDNIIQETGSALINATNNVTSKVSSVIIVVTKNSTDICSFSD